MHYVIGGLWVGQHHRKIRRTKKKEEKEKKEKRRKGLLPDKPRVPLKDEVGWMMHVNRVTADYTPLAGSWERF
jgi:hypothetical protein